MPVEWNKGDILKDITEFGGNGLLSDLCLTRVLPGAECR